MTSGQANGELQGIAVSELDAIVREVIARLQAQGGVAVPQSESLANIKTNGSKPAAAKQAADAGANTARVTERVITMATLAGKLTGVQTISVLAGAVVTPSAKEFLRDRGISIHIAPRAGAAPQAAATRLVIGVADTPYEPAALLKRLPAASEQLARVGLVDVVSELASRVALGGERGVLFTGEPEAALCLANRSAGVRAVRVGCVTSVRRARQSLGANLLVLNPAGKSGHELERTLAEFCLGSCDCPDRYRKQLS